MERKTRQEKKEEERRIIAEMESALQENKDGENGGSGGVENGVKNNAENKNDVGMSASKKSKWLTIHDDTTPQTVHCRRCKTMMENGVCPTCGFRIYMPMSKEKRDKIRLILTGVGMAIFVVLFVCIQIAKS